MQPGTRFVVAGLRSSMLAGGTSALGLGIDFGVVIAALAVLVWVGCWMYPKLIS